MALQTITAVGDSGTIAAAAIILAADPTDLATTGDSGTISAAAIVNAVVPQQLATTGDSGTIAAAAIILAGDPHDITARRASGKIAAAAILDGGVTVQIARTTGDTGAIIATAALDGGDIPSAETGSTRRYAPIDLPVVTWTHAATGQAHRLDVTGQPTMSAARGIGYEAATIPCHLTESERQDIHGAVVHVHSTGWRGVVLARPEPNEPLLVTGYGKWVGSLKTRSVIFSDDRLDVWRGWVPETVYAGDGITPAVLTQQGWYFGISKNIEIGPYANSGISYYDERGIIHIYMEWEKTKPNSKYGIVVYGGPADGVIDSVFMTSVGDGGNVSLSVNKPYIVVALYNTTTAWTPTAGGEGIFVHTLTVHGTSYTTPDTERVGFDILSQDVPDKYFVAAAERRPYVQHTAVNVGTLIFDSTTANEKFAELMVRAPIEYGWYAVSDGRCFPHIYDRPTTPAYLLRLDDCPSLPQLEQAPLDELTSGTNVLHDWRVVPMATDVPKSTTFVPDTDPTHPLVALGIPRYGTIELGRASVADAQAAGAVANAENGRARVKGDVTTSQLRTIAGGPADHARVKPGEMVRVEWLGITARIERIEWRGRYVTLTLDSAGYHLAAYLAALR